MKFCILLILYFLINYSFGQSTLVQIPIIWTPLSSIPTDFTNNWEYKEGIYINQWGQVSCDGFCPEKANGLKDSTGRIMDKYLDSMYTILDTNHQFQNLVCQTNIYQFSGSKYMHYENNEDLLLLSSQMNVSTHSQLNIKWTKSNDYATSNIFFNSILSDTKPIYFKAIGGWIKIDPDAYKRDILKMQFYIRYLDSEDTKNPLYWTGVVYTSLN